MRGKAGVCAWEKLGWPSWLRFPPPIQYNLLFGFLHLFLIIRGLGKWNLLVNSSLWAFLLFLYLFIVLNGSESDRQKDNLHDLFHQIGQNMNLTRDAGSTFPAELVKGSCISLLSEQIFWLIAGPW